ncbi:hypothetical protein CSOJ01_09126 [Colletotrichum sojae]|uniref:DUF7791 domain-containing protein n=1 Tax=Colletotrichum sojae TaxID=2175907 RepID=A0A8H6MR77_9PEZI|nr:hypothetical protein CSOJ01_09126 [Colletotrichum sojae]
MEAVGGVGLAAAILQFIEFTAKLVKEGSERAAIKKKHIEKLTEEIHALNIEICNGMRSNTADNAVKKLGAECMDISRKLLEALAQLRARSRDTRWASFVEALRAVWKKGEIQDLRDRLDQYRDTLHTSTLTSQLNDTKTLTAEVKDLRTESMSANESLRVDLLQAIQTQKAKAPRDPYQDETISRCLHSLAAEESEDLRRRQRRLLAQLSFASGYEREHQIQEAHAKTFQWVWDDPKIREGCPAWSHFPSWLEGDGRKIYWITGKAASGKSTLMECIVRDSRCNELLKRWAGDLPLVSTNALSQRPDLIPKVFPERWERLLLPDSDGSPWGLGELDQAIKALARSAAGNFKLFIFVDGLDEFGGEHDALIQLCQAIVSFDNVKACLSSRPWVVFEEAFRQEPRLKLENITFDDIVAYITDKFTRNSGYQALRKRPSDLPSNLIKKVAKRSRGVFLWVILVVKSDTTVNYFHRTVKDFLQDPAIDELVTTYTSDFGLHLAIISVFVQVAKSYHTTWDWHCADISNQRGDVLQWVTLDGVSQASRARTQTGSVAILLDALEKTTTHHQINHRACRASEVCAEIYLEGRVNSYFLLKFQRRDFTFCGRPFDKDWLLGEVIKGVQDAFVYRAEIVEAFIESGIDRNHLLKHQADIESAFEEFPEISKRLLKMIAQKEK